MVGGITIIQCPNCLAKETKTSLGRTPILVRGRFCIVCGYHLPIAPTMHEIRVKAGKKAQQTIQRRRAQSNEDIFSV